MKTVADIEKDFDVFVEEYKGLLKKTCDMSGLTPEVIGSLTDEQVMMLRDAFAIIDKAESLSYDVFATLKGLEYDVEALKKEVKSLKAKA